MDHVITGLPDASSLLDRPAMLREEADREGFLFFPSLIPSEDILSLRSGILDVLDSHHYILEGTELLEGIGDVKAIQESYNKGEVKRGIGASIESYADIQRIESFHALAHHPALLSVFEKLFDGEVFPHPRNIARLMLPRKDQAPTPSHQDYIHIQGTKNVWTAWIPLGDCPRSLGGLTILKASHMQDIMPVKAAEGAGGLEVYLCGENYQWIEHDYQAGDVLIFSSLTVHKALPHKLPDKIRLSCDFRYQLASEEIEPKSLNPHYDILAWEEIYKDWKNTALQFYWKKMDLHFSTWDESIREQKEDIC